MSREYPLRFKCAHEGCPEYVIYRYSTRRDLAESFELKDYGGTKGWLCTRHSRPNEVLSGLNPETRFEVVSRQESYGRFFGTQGFVHGPGFKLFANDFPAGTKLIVTARIELPETEAPSPTGHQKGGDK
jgi:hypothetical protein